MHNIKKKILIPIEIITRDLDSRLLIALRLLQKSRSWEIIFGNGQNVGDYWRNKSDKEPFIFLSKGTSYSKLYYIQLIKKGGFYFLLDEEGAIFSNYVIKFWPRGGRENDLIKYMSKIFFWGNDTKEQYKKRHSSFLSDSQIEITGNPRFDLCKKEYEPYYSSRKKNSYKDKTFIMIDTAFGTYNNIVDINLQNEHWKNLKYEKNRGEVNRHEWFEKTKPLYEYQKKLFYEFIDGIKFLCESLPNVDFLLRPHPIEKKETYETYFKDLDNISISNEGAAVEKFRYTKVLIHNGCSTAVEASFSGITSICYLPIYNEDLVQVLPRDISIVSNNKDDLLLKIKNILSENNDTSHLNSVKDILQDQIDNLNYDSSIKIANIINDFDYSKKVKIDYDFTIRSLLHIILPKFLIKNLQKCKSLLSNLFKNEDVANSFKDRDKIKFNELNIDDIKKRIKGFQNVDETIPFNINVKNLDKNLFKIYVETLNE